MHCKKNSKQNIRSLMKCTLATLVVLFLSPISVANEIFISSSCGDKKSASGDSILPLSADLVQQLNLLICSNKPRLFNGVVFIGFEGEVLYSLQRGLADQRVGTAFSDRARFRIQSNSKQITAVLALLEADKGNLDLHSPISKYLPKLQQQWADQVTTHHLLNMSSGIKDLDESLLFEPGSDYFYSNPGYGLIGDILEAITQESYADLSKHLFTRLDMHDSGPYVFRGENYLVPGYALQDQTFAPFDIETLGMSSDFWRRFTPTGGLISSAKDLLRWENLLHNGRVLSPHLYQQMVSPGPPATHAAFGDQMLHYGYGLRVGERHDVQIIGHAGRGLGYVNTKVYIPDHGISLVVLENAYHDTPELVYYYEKEILSLVLKSLRNSRLHLANDNR